MASIEFPCVAPTKSVRSTGTPTGHHLYRNNGSWWIHYTRYLPDYTVRRVRHSLRTRDLGEARLRRDQLIEALLMERGAA